MKKYYSLLIFAVVCIFSSCMSTKSYEKEAETFSSDLHKKYSIEAKVVLSCPDAERHCVYYLYQNKLFIHDLIDGNDIQIEDFSGTDEIIIPWIGDAVAYDDCLIIIGGGFFKGIDQAIRYDTYSRQGYIIDYGRIINRKQDIIEIIKGKLTKEGSAEFENEYTYANMYYSLNGDMIQTQIYSGTIDNNQIILELAQSNSGNVMGSFYFRTIGPERRIYFSGEIIGSSIILITYGRDSSRTEKTGVFNCTIVGDEIDGTTSIDGMGTYHVYLIR